MNTKNYRFSRLSDEGFTKTLRQRVNAYFKENNISRNANFNMVFKTIFMIALYFTPYFLIIFGVLEANWSVLLGWFIMAFGMSGIGLSVMHDANHGSYSKNKTVNNIISYIITFVGGNVPNWRIQHNVLHHTYTNVHGMDEDLDGPPFLRFSPHAKRRKIHKYQHIYAWFFYGMMTMSWSTAKEFIQAIGFKKKGLTDSKRTRNIIIGLVFWKIFYFSYALVLPLIFSPVSAWITVLGFLIMHFVCGLTLSAIFQSAHVMETSDYPLPNNEGELSTNWFVHQLHTTANFAQNNRILSWFVGGLNYQIEHHLFPDICHVHYRKISKIVKSTAEQFNLPYNAQATFIDALVAHTKMLKQLGRA